jgi:hypothetical protein
MLKILRQAVFLRQARPTGQQKGEDRVTHHKNLPFLGTQVNLTRRRLRVAACPKKRGDRYPEL